MVRIIGLTGLLAVMAAPAWAGTINFSNIVVAMEENTNYATVFPTGCSSTSCTSTKMPNLAALIKTPPSGNHTAVANKYYGIGHPSLGNYLSIWAGDFDGVLGQNCAKNTTCQNLKDACWNSIPAGPWNGYVVGGGILFDDLSKEINAHGHTWASYDDGLPAVGSTVCSSGKYVARHNPPVYFADVRNTAMKNDLVPFTQFATDVAANRLPTVSFVIPDTCHDAHDGGSLCGLPQADAWLQSNVIAKLFASNGPPAFKAGGHGVLVVAFDEAASGCGPIVGTCASSPQWGGGGQVVFTITGPGIVGGNYRSSTVFQHPSLAEMISDGVGGGDFQDTGLVNDMSEFFTP